jgi:hypothetical protein
MKVLSVGELVFAAVFEQQALMYASHVHYPTRRLQARPQARIISVQHQHTGRIDVVQYRAILHARGDTPQTMPAPHTRPGFPQPPTTL